MATLAELVRNSARVLRSEGPGAFWRAFVLRFFKMQPVPRAFVPGEWYDFNAEDLRANDAIVSRFESMHRLDVKTINWFHPVFAYPMAGVNNIFTAARVLREKHGVESRFIFYGEPKKSEDELRGIIARFFPDFANAAVVRVETPHDLARVPEADINFATRWDSCYFVLKANRCKAKAYFVQDFEPLFFPAGSESALSEETYRFGFARVCVTPSTFLATKPYGGSAMWFHQPVDARYNFPPATKPAGPVRIVFYGRPTNPRNGFGLGVEALRRVKARFGERVEIVSMGEPWDPRDYGLAGIIENKGVMNLTELGEFYRSAHIGLGLIFTRHPSLQPLEYWANGIAVVTNENPVNDWCFQDGENCLIAPPSVSLLADGIARLVEDPALRDHLAKQGAAWIASLRWEDQAERIWRYLTREDRDAAPVLRP